MHLSFCSVLEQDNETLPERLLCSRPVIVYLRTVGVEACPSLKLILNIRADTISLLVDYATTVLIIN